MNVTSKRKNNPFIYASVCIYKVAHGRQTRNSFVITSSLGKRSSKNRSSFIDIRQINDDDWWTKYAITFGGGRKMLGRCFFEQLYRRTVHQRDPVRTNLRVGLIRCARYVYYVTYSFFVIGSHKIIIIVCTINDAILSYDITRERRGVRMTLYII